MIRSARAAEDAVQDLCRATMSRPSLIPAEVDVALTYLADAVAALPQACSQLCEVLDQAKANQVLETDGMADTDDSTLAIDTACLHLEEARAAAVALYALLDAAHNQTAHVISHASLDER